MMRAACFVSIVVIAASAAAAEPPAPAKADLDRLDCRWTFGNHEPLAMYRRAGSRATGGMEGGALWLEDWHRWFDSEASTRLMEDLGLNILHCRFYKGLGWQYESRDFPNVQRFVENCHKHGIRVLAYVQFSTLYYETMLAEIPDLADWAAIDENGRKRTYHGPAYYRWRPCINAPGFEPYLKKVVAIALGEGGFDGIMFDNCDAPPCHCPRCAALFRKHLAEIPDPENRFGLPTVATTVSGEIAASDWVSVVGASCATAGTVAADRAPPMSSMATMVRKALRSPRTVWSLTAILLVWRATPDGASRLFGRFRLR